MTQMLHRHIWAHLSTFFLQWCGMSLVSSYAQMLKCACGIKVNFSYINMVRRQIKQSYDMLVTNCNHIFLLDNGEGNHLLFFGNFLANVGHLGKVLK